MNVPKCDLSATLERVRHFALQDVVVPGLVFVPDFVSADEQVRNVR